MKEGKEFQSNANYFKRGETLKFVGIGLIVLSVVLFFFGWDYLSYILMSVSFPSGVVLSVLSTFGRSNESDIDDYVKEHMEGVEHKAEDDKNFQKRLLKAIPPQTLEDYDWSEGLMYKRGKNGEVRSSRYCKAVIYPLDTGLLISYRKLSLVSDEVENDEVEIPYTNISVFEMIREEKNLVWGKNSVRIKRASLVIRCADGWERSFPMEDSIMTEEFVRKVNGQIATAKAAE